MKIAILGSNGFLGRGLSSLAKDKHEVFGFGRNELPPKGAEFDLLIDATSQHSLSDLSGYTSSLLKFLSVCHVKRIVILQSFSTITSNPVSANLVNFGVVPDIATPYSEVKLAKEKELLLLDLDAHVEFLYLPLILGEGGIWHKHSDTLKSGKSVMVQDVDVYFTDIEAIYKNLFLCGEVRTLIFLGKMPLYKLLDLNLNKISTSNYKYGKNTDLIFCFLFGFFRRYPLIPHSADFFISKLRKKKFPSFFYWELFKRQSRFDV